MQQLILSQATAALRRIPVYLVDASTEQIPMTGITFAAGDIKISKNGAAEANHAGTVTELAGGMYFYEATAGELDTPGFWTARFTKSGVHTFVAAVQVDVEKASQSRLPAALIGGRMDSYVSAMADNVIAEGQIDAGAIVEIQSGLARASALAIVNDFIDTEVAAIKAKTDNLPNDPADQSDMVASFTAVNSIITNIQSRLPAALVSGRIDASVGAMAPDTLTGSALATDAVNEIQSGLNIPSESENATALLDLPDGIEPGWTLRQAQRIQLAALAGKISGAGTDTVTIRDAIDVKNRIVATTDVPGNRLNVIYNKL